MTLFLATAAVLAGLALLGAAVLSTLILLVALVIALWPEQKAAVSSPETDRTERMPAYYRQVSASSTTIRLRRRHYVP